MKCKDCNGSGVHATDYEVEEGAIPCGNCGGTGRHSFLWPIRLRLSMWIDMRLEDLRFTRIGTKWWRQYGRIRNAHKLASENTLFALQVMHGRSLERLRVFATAIESGANIDRNYRIETRMCAERELACKIKERQESPNEH